MYMEFIRRNKGIIFVIFVSTAYWIYLLITSSMIIKFDALSYEKLGRIIYNGGLIDYLKSGLHREPLYPMMIAASMKLSDISRVSFFKILAMFQMGILFISQILLYVLLIKMRIRKFVACGTVLYFGISPAVVNSAFSMFSEIAAYPFVILVILFGIRAMIAMRGKRLKGIIFSAVFLSLAFLGATFVKGIFQYVFLCFMALAGIFSAISFLKGEKTCARNSLIFIILSVFIFGVTVVGYRYLNLKYNGNFEFTDRYAVLLFGNAGKRSDTMGRDQFIAHIVSILGEGVCRLFYDSETCGYCTFQSADLYWIRHLPELLAGKTLASSQKKIVSLSVKKVQENPIQYFALTFLEGLKMAFWESTKIGFVQYPPGLSRLFDSSIARNGIRLVVSFLTYISMLYCLMFVWIKRMKLFLLDESISSENILLLVFLIIVPFTFLYSLFSILTRFALPIVSLYLVCIAFFINQMINKIETRIHYV